MAELDRYLDYLISKKTRHNPQKLRQDWAGGLKDIKMSSIELQKDFTIVTFDKDFNIEGIRKSSPEELTS